MAQITAVQTTYGPQDSIGFAGMLADNGPHDIVTMRQDEASASVFFGRCVMFGSPSDRHSAKLPATEDAVIAGVVVHSHCYSPTIELDSDGGLKPTVILNVLRKGRILVVTEDAVTVGARMYVRGVAAGDPEFLGGFVTADDSTDTVNTTNQVVALTSGAAGDLIVVEVDFTNKPGI